MNGFHVVKPDDIRALTGIRGAAAILVVLYHFFGGAHVFGPLQPAVDHGYVAVDLFFVLSGYVMMLTYGSRFAAAVRREDVLDFLFKRIVRVYPLFLVVTVVLLALASLGFDIGARHDPITVASNLLLLQAWDVAGSVCGPAWSISTELAAYLAFPALALLLARDHRAGWTIAGLAVAVLLFVASRSDAALLQTWRGGRNGPLDIYMGDTPFPLLRCLAGFALGAVAFRASRTTILAVALRVPGTGDAIALVILAALLRTHADVALVPLFALFVVALTAGRSLGTRVLGSAPLHWLGLVSYSIYLVHQPAEHVLLAPLARVAAAHHVPHAFSVSRFALLTLVLALATGSYYAIERPARDRMRAAIARAEAPRGRAAEAIAR